MKDTWVGTSWKMNKTQAEALEWTEGLRAWLYARDVSLQPFVIPPFTVLRDVAAYLAPAPVVVGAQNLHWSDAGAWTGEISAPMIADCGATLVEIGHSERRTHFGETDETVGRKTVAALRHGLTPLVCVGETADDKAAGRSAEVLQVQVEAALAEVADTPKVILAYEPVWSIGEHGTPAAPEYADEMHACIKAVATALTGTPVKVLYGGSVNAANCEALIRCPNINGLFIGRSALQIEGYIEVLNRCNAALNLISGRRASA